MTNAESFRRWTSDFGLLPPTLDSPYPFVIRHSDFVIRYYRFARSNCGGPPAASLGSPVIRRFDEASR